MTLSRFFWLSVAFLVTFVCVGQGLAQSKSPACGPDHAIIYKRASALLDKAEKKLNDKYTAEAKGLVKEANSLFSILVKECAPTQQERELTEKELQQEAINKKLIEDSQGQADRLNKSAEEKLKKSLDLDAKGQSDEATVLQRQAKGESERAQVLAIKAEIFSLRIQEMVFRFLIK
jgi:hypothetical protein